MKLTALFMLMAFGATSFAADNLSDAIDRNEVPSELEEREEETINQSDAIDENETPAMLEDREKEEEWRDDYEEKQEDFRGE